MQNEIDIYNSIVADAEDALDDLPEVADFIGDEIMKAKLDSKNAVHCAFSPSKSNGWVVCPAYLDRSAQWGGSPEPAIRGTIVHHFMSRVINLLKTATAEKRYPKELDMIMCGVFSRPEWLSPIGVSSARALIKKLLELGIGDTESEVFIMSPTYGDPNKNLRFGGSIDALHIKGDGKSAEIHIYDLKTGRHPVSPDCWQLKCYALLVQERLVKEGYKDFKYTMGIAQDGRLSEFSPLNRKHIEDKFIKIIETMDVYRDVYLKNGLNVEINDERDSGFGECFNPCSYCRFCKGCYKGGF